MDIPVIELAEQLTLHDYKIFKAIPTVELTAQAWMKEGKAPTAKRFIERFNDVSFWSATEIVLCPNIKRRVAVLKRWIQVAEQLRSMNNYHVLMAIISGLSHGCVSRLKLTWSVGCVKLFVLIALGFAKTKCSSI
jgi:Rap guanine nucleotide exchange factor 2